MKILCLLSCHRLRKQKTVRGKAFVMEICRPLTGNVWAVRREGNGMGGRDIYIYIYSVHIYSVRMCLHFMYVYALYIEVQTIISEESSMSIFHNHEKK